MLLSKLVQMLVFNVIFETDYDEVRGRPMSNGVTYHFAVTAYSYLADNEGSPFKTLESGETRVAVTPHS